MPYRTNPFLERMSERTTSDQEFVRLFSPKILDRLAEDAFDGAVHIFRSPPGGGKTTLLRAFTPSALRAFWNVRRVQEMNESYQQLLARNILHEQEGPQLLGVLLSCASGYADLPPGATISQESLFRALFDCRVVLRSLRNLALLLGFSSLQQLDSIRLEYDELGCDLKTIPIRNSAAELAQWAEYRERQVYAQLDSIVGNGCIEAPAHVRFESILWLQSVRFLAQHKEVAPKRMLMVDDLHKLRRKQRALLIEEMTEIRPQIPVWLAERSIALGDQLLSQGTREGRDLREYSLEEFWSTNRGQHQFTVFAQNILDRRLEAQSLIPTGVFSQYLRAQFQPDEIKEAILKGFSKFRDVAARYDATDRYSEWLSLATQSVADASFESLCELYVTRILIARDELKRQMSLELGPLSSEQLDQRDNSQVKGAADIFAHEELKIPYYFGIERLCVMATYNIEELLSLAGVLYDNLRAKLILRKPDLLLSPVEQEKVLRDVAKHKRDFIPRNHTEGTRAQRLLDAVGAYCRERTFLPNAPYAPGVTGVRLSQAQISRLNSGRLRNQGAVLMRVLAECVAENLLVSRASAATGARDSGTVFYLNRTLCAHYGLPLQMGGWQDLNAEELINWMERGKHPTNPKLLETL